MILSRLELCALAAIALALIGGVIIEASLGQTTYQPVSTKAANTTAQQSNSNAKTAQTPTQSGKSATKAPASKLIDINFATVEQLKTLLGINGKRPTTKSQAC